MMLPYGYHVVSYVQLIANPKRQGCLFWYARGTAYGVYFHLSPLTPLRVSHGSVHIPKCVRSSSVLNGELRDVGQTHHQSVGRFNQR